MINGSKAPIVGRICMDQTLEDVTEFSDVKWELKLLSSVKVEI